MRDFLHGVLVVLVRAMKQLHVCAVHKLDEQTALALQAAGRLEEELAEQLPPNVGSAWCVGERIEPLLQGWVAHQLGLLRSWSVRILSGEHWQPITAPRGCSRCASACILECVKPRPAKAGKGTVIRFHLINTLIFP